MRFEKRDRPPIFRWWWHLGIAGFSVVQVVIFIGIQASGKSTFYAERFADTHIRINLDMLKTRHREKRLVETCLEIGQPFVIDNTNPTPDDRGKYIISAKEKRFEIVGYYFASNIGDATARNGRRSRQVPEKAIRGTYSRLVLPCYREGFDRLYYVRLLPEGKFSVDEWQNEI
jgi:predicted kinase